MHKSLTSSGSVQGSGDTGLSKWQMFAVVGLGFSVAAVGLGAIWYIRKRRRTVEATKLGDGTAPGVLNNDTTQSLSPEVNAGSQSVPSQPLESVVVKTSDALEQKAKGNELFKQKKFREAITVYEEALTMCSSDDVEDSAALHHNIAACLENMIPSIEGKDEKDETWKEVAMKCTTALSLKPKYVKALIRRHRAYDALGKPREALLDIVRVLVLDESQSQHFQTVMPRLLKAIGKELAETNYVGLEPLEPPPQLIRAYFSTFQWKDDLSKSTLKGLWTDDEEQFEKEPFIKAASLFKNNVYTDMLQLLTESIESGNEVFKAHAYLLRGTLYCLWRRDQDALSDLLHVIETRDLPIEMHADAHIKRAAIFAGLCELDKCLEEFKKAETIKPDHVDIYIQRARVYLESEDVNVLMKAPDDLDIALKLAPTAPHPRYCYGAVFHRGGLLSGSMHLLQGAKTHFEEAYNRFPDCVEGIILYSLYLQDAQEIDKCEDLLKKAIKLEPDNASAHFSLSLLHLLVHQDIDQAMQSLETAIAMDTSCIQAYEALASLEMQRNNKDRASELYQQAINNSRSLMELQQAYVAYEVFSTQNQVCEEYNINPLDLMNSRIAAAKTGGPFSQ